MSPRPNRQPPQPIPQGNDPLLFEKAEAAVYQNMGDHQFHTRTRPGAPVDDAERRRRLGLPSPVPDGQTARRQLSDWTAEEIAAAKAKIEREEDRRLFAEDLTDPEAVDAREQDNEQAIEQADLDYYSEVGAGMHDEPDGYDG